MVLTLLITWLLVSAPVTAACVLVARGGLQEDRCQGWLSDEQIRSVLLEGGSRPAVPGPGVTIG